MKVSIAMPAYKAKYLKKAIESILNQSYKDFELIIVNDESPEDLSIIVNEFKDERIKYYVNPKNLGKINLVDNWNLCLSYSCGEYFVLASDDDIYHEDFLRDVISLLDKYPETNIAHARAALIDKNDNIISISPSCPEFESCLDFIHQRLFNNRLFFAPDFIYKTEVIKKHGGFVKFPLAWFSDEATWYMLIADSKGICCTNDIRFFFRQSDINISTSSYKTETKLEATILFEKWLQDFIKEIKPLTDIDLIQQNYIKENMYKYINEHIYYLLCESKYKSFFNIFFFKHLYFKRLSLNQKIKATIYKLINI